MISRREGEFRPILDEVENNEVDRFILVSIRALPCYPIRAR